MEYLEHAWIMGVDAGTIAHELAHVYQIKRSVEASRAKVSATAGVLRIHKSVNVSDIQPRRKSEVSFPRTDSVKKYVTAPYEIDAEWASLHVRARSFIASHEWTHTPREWRKEVEELIAHMTTPTVASLEKVWNVFYKERSRGRNDIYLDAVNSLPEIRRDAMKRFGEMIQAYLPLLKRMARVLDKKT